MRILSALLDTVLLPVDVVVDIATLPILLIHDEKSKTRERVEKIEDNLRWEGKKMDGTKIEWTDATWNPLRGCSRVSAGCENCYAERVAARYSGPGMAYEGLARFKEMGLIQRMRVPRWTGKVRLIEEKLVEPLRWYRPRQIFVNSMSDLFHENVSDEWIDRIMAVMALAYWHTFQVLTKRPDRALRYFSGRPYDRILFHADRMRETFRSPEPHGIGDPVTSPWRNVWLGVSVEDQVTWNERVGLLRQVPAAVRFVSYEPALGPVDPGVSLYREAISSRVIRCEGGKDDMSMLCQVEVKPRVDWVIVGGESGPGARPFDIAWADDIVRACRAASVPVFVKQLGSFPITDNVNRWDFGDGVQTRELASNMAASAVIKFKDRKGGDMAEWPEDLRVREFPR